MTVGADSSDMPRCVHRWRRGLAERVGLSEPAIEKRVDELQRYCARNGVTPAELLSSWEERRDLTLRRRPGATGRPNLAVESFLIHNGVNVFGEIVCVPARREDLAAQGRQFVPDR